MSVMYLITCNRYLTLNQSFFSTPEASQSSGFLQMTLDRLLIVLEKRLKVPSKSILTVTHMVFPSVPGEKKFEFLILFLIVSVTPGEDGHAWARHEGWEGFTQTSQTIMHLLCTHKILFYIHLNIYVWIYKLWNCLVLHVKLVYINFCTSWNNEWQGK